MIVLMAIFVTPNFKPQSKRNGEANTSSHVKNTQRGFNASKHNYFLWEIRNSDFFLERVSFDELTVRQKNTQ